MIGYFDTSAIVPLLVEEPSSSHASALWNDADRLLSIRLAYAEARAALAQAQRLGRLTTRGLRIVVSKLEVLYGDLDLVEIDDELVRDAGQLAEKHGLRSYDSVHLAAASRLRDSDSDVVVIAGDAALLRAATSEGMSTADLCGP